MTMATTTRGSSAGAMPTNQLSLPFSFSAVPGFAGYVDAGDAAAVPVPFCTTPSSTSRTRPAVVLLTACISFVGEAEKLRSPLALFTLSTR